MQKSMHTNNGRRGPCVHVRSGRVDGPKDCVFNYECSHCAFDQWLDYMDEAGVANPAPRGKSTSFSIQAMQVI